MLLVVFGAGASYDCLPEVVPYGDWRPPLTNDVFDLGRAHYATIAGHYVGSVGVMDQVSKGLIANPKSTLERELARMVKRSKADDELEIGLLAVQFYLSQLFRDCSTGMLEARGRLTNYARFVRRMEEWRVDHHEQTTYVTFNYDTLLDAALRERGSLENWEDYVRPHRAYFKVHGSVDWAQRAEVIGNPIGRNPQAMIWAAPRLKRQRQLEAWRIRADPMVVDMDDAIWAPAIALPVEDKDELVLPPEHLEALKERLQRVTRVLTFGWRARETEFMKLLKSVPVGVPVHVLTASLAGVDEAAENLRRAGLDGPTMKTAMEFGEFVNGGELVRLLERI